MSGIVAASKSQSFADPHHPHEQIRSLYRTQTALGGCWLDTVGHLKPCDDKHAPIKLYRTYGEWWEAGHKEKAPEDHPKRVTSRYWPFGQDVTKLYQTQHTQHKFHLDQRCLDKVRPYIPPKPSEGSFSNSSSLPDLRSTRHLPRVPNLDLQYHASFHKNDRRPPSMLGISGSIGIRSGRSASPAASVTSSVRGPTGAYLLPPR
mmetsp:Transcript_105681/g.193784  ORF Transcript_105681/g.193784 Transcript_105681/m.193784 type:complete len:204 (+) Transcript_105681:98-709(+)